MFLVRVTLSCTEITGSIANPICEKPVFHANFYNRLILNLSERLSITEYAGQSE